MLVIKKTTLVTYSMKYNFFFQEGLIDTELADMAITTDVQVLELFIEILHKLKKVDL